MKRWILRPGASEEEEEEKSTKLHHRHHHNDQPTFPCLSQNALRRVLPFFDNPRRKASWNLLKLRTTTIQWVFPPLTQMTKAIHGWRQQRRQTLGGSQPNRNGCLLFGHHRIQVILLPRSCTTRELPPPRIALRHQMKGRFPYGHKPKLHLIRSTLPSNHPKKRHVVVHRKGT